MTMDLRPVSIGNDKMKTIEAELATASTFDASTTTVSTLTQPALSPNSTKSHAASSRINIGQYPTPPKQVLAVNESLYEDGYDSDGQIGLFMTVYLVCKQLNSMRIPLEVKSQYLR